MCQRIGELRESVARFAKGFDPALLSSADASSVVEDASAIESIMAAVKSLAVARVTETGSWKEAGFRTPAEAIAKSTGTSNSAAQQVIDTGRRLASNPEVADAVKAGELSTDQAVLVAMGAEADPDSAARLIDHAKDVSLGELREEVGRTKAAACPDLEERRRRIHSKRRLRDWTDAEGVRHLTASGNPEDGARIMAGLAPLTNAIFRESRRAGMREPMDAYGFDALVRLAGGRREARGGRTDFSHKIIFRVDYTAWMRGGALADEVCELVGRGPVPMSVVEEVLATDDPFIAAVLTKGKQVVGVAHLGRAPTAHQQTALEWLYPSCAALGCSARVRLQRDHRIDWRTTHHTKLEELDLLCAHHHRLKTHERWALVRGAGKRAFVPPDDPRHPRNKPRPAGGRGRPRSAARKPGAP